MNKQNVTSAIDVLTHLFYVNHDTYMGISTLELYTELGLLHDSRLLAEVIEETQAFDLLHSLKLFDMKSVERIENVLRGNLR